MSKPSDTGIREQVARLREAWTRFAQKGADLALWHLPGPATVEMLASLNSDPSVLTLPLEQRPAGFIVAPFRCTDFRNALYLKSDYLETFDLPASPPLPAGQMAVPETGSLKEYFLAVVNKAKWAVSEGFFDKLVPARTLHLPLPPDFDPLSAFAKARAQYPTAFVSLLQTREWGTWIGASPELLVERDEHRQIFRTVALAGTQAVQDHERIEELSWKQKEIEEQALVSRFIVDCFKKIRLREFSETGPKTVRYGNSAHLMSDFRVDLKSGAYGDLASVMLNLLHPTSAVCGSPKEKALEFLLANEPFDRELYAGYLGPVNIRGLTRLHVNIRCARLDNTSALLFAGAGVTADSDAELEWAETGLKIQTMKDILS